MNEMLSEAKELEMILADRGEYVASGCITMLVKEIEERDKKLKKVLDLVEEQASDEGIWFIAETASEAYLQQELRTLHSSIEALA